MLPVLGGLGGMNGIERSRIERLSPAGGTGGCMLPMVDVDGVKPKKPLME
jgi:hypothetical protein